MASTEPGRQWLVKSLHPSDELVTIGGVPDMTASSTVFLNYQNVFAINPPASVVAGQQSWNFDSTLIPDPIQPMASLSGDSGFVNTVLTAHTNPQLSGAVYPACLQSWLASGVVRWRLAYMSVSMYQDGPALADQGTLVAAQVPVEYAKLHAQYGPVAAGCACTRPIRVMQPGVVGLAYTNLQAMPNAHFGQSKEGVYMPLHLDSLDEGWRGLHDLQLWSAGIVGYNNPSGSVVAGYVLPVSASAPAGAYPYPTAIQAYYANATGANPTGDPTCKPANVKWGFISGTNLSWQSRITCYVRHGWEVMVAPTSQLSSLQRVSPRFDPQALDNYSRICRELKDAYPVDFNDLGKLWEVLKAAAKVAGPVVSAMPGIGAVAGPLMTGGSALLDILTTRRGKKTEHERQARETDITPAAAKEAVASITAAPVVQTARLAGRKSRRGTGGGKRAQAARTQSGVRRKKP